MLEAGANPDIRDPKGHNGLVYAAGANNIELLNCLLKHGAKVASKWHFGYLALYEATRRGSVEAMTLLLSAGATSLRPHDWARPGKYSNPLLMLVMNDDAFSSSESQLDALNLLLAHGASWREVDGHGEDALMRATMWGNNRLVAALISNGATVGQTNQHGFNALDIAAFNAGSCLDNQGVITELNAYVVRIFFHVMFCAQQQPDWRILQAGAIKKSPHPIIRELLAFDVVKVPQPPAVGAIAIEPIPFDLAGLVQTILYACRNAGDDWDRTATEKILTFAGVPMPVIELYCDYIEAFPKIRARLFGSNAANELSDAHFLQFFYGIAALTEKFNIDEHALNDAYDALGWEAIRGSRCSLRISKFSRFW
ncbi:MAG: ankyrin repeat domain-containing protein [Burkholderiaceae bacterium]